jgi:class 3 adenylate cyclase/YHS domain-containing protein
MDHLSLAQIAEMTSESPDVVRRLSELGLIGGDGESYSLRDVEIVRLVRTLLRRGADIERVVTAFEQQRRVVDSHLEHLVPTGPTFDADAVADELALGPTFARRLAEATGIGADGWIDAEDVAALRMVKTVIDAGLPEDALVQLLRVFGDALGRIGEAEVKLFHIHVHERLRADGVVGAELFDVTESITRSIETLAEPALVYLHRRALAHAFRDDLTVHLIDELGLEDRLGAADRLWRAVLFVDLCDFTPLTAAMGDATAVDVVERFASAARHHVNRSGGRAVKHIGDAVLAVFPDADAAIASALELDAQLSTEPRFPAVHAGIDCGAVLYHDGDYFGSVVNTAARIAAEAERHELLVTEPARRAARELETLEFIPVGERSLKGLSEPLEVYRVQRVHTAPPRRRVDPVCGMELNDDEVAASVTVADGERVVFCSARCLRTFVNGPAR